MLDTITTYPETESKELTELRSRLKYVDVYLNEALPRAYEEESRNNLELNIFVTSCGTRGCVGFHMANALGYTLLPYVDGVIHKVTYDIVCEMNRLIFGEFKIQADDVAFAGSTVSLDERKASMQEYRADLVYQIESLT